MLLARFFRFRNGVFGTAGARAFGKLGGAGARPPPTHGNYQRRADALRWNGSRRNGAGSARRGATRAGRRAARHGVARDSLRAAKAYVLGKMRLWNEGD